VFTNNTLTGTVPNALTYVQFLDANLNCFSDPMYTTQTWCTPPAPTNVQASVVKDGIQVRWHPLTHAVPTVHHEHHREHKGGPLVRSSVEKGCCCCRYSFCRGYKPHIHE
jgi:hypothetical protein